MPASPELPQIAAADLVNAFENLGQDCELGIVQRWCGAEPLGLLRFSTAPLDQLLTALENRFSGVEDPATLEIFPEPLEGEHLARIGRYDFIYHTGYFSHEVSADEVHASEVKRLEFLKRKLIAQLEKPSKMFVRTGLHGQAELEVLLTALRRYGPVTLLSVIPGRAEQVRTVVRLGDGLLQGYVERYWLTDPPRPQLKLDEWLDVLRNAHVLGQGGTTATSLPPPVHPPVPNLLAQPLPGSADAGYKIADWSTSGEVPPPPRVGLPVTAHTLRTATTHPVCWVQSCVIGAGLSHGTMHALSMWVWLPTGFSGEDVSAVFLGYASVVVQAADMAIRDRWQKIWTSTRIPQSGSAAVALQIAGNPGDVVYSSDWRLEESPCPS